MWRPAGGRPGRPRFGPDARTGCPAADGRCPLDAPSTAPDRLRAARAGTARWIRVRARPARRHAATGRWTRAGRGTNAGRGIGRAHVGTPVTNAPLVCRLLLETKK